MKTRRDGAQHVPSQDLRSCLSVYPS